jgi:hypothetical protein
LVRFFSHLEDIGIHFLFNPLIIVDLNTIH